MPRIRYINVGSTKPPNPFAQLLAFIVAVAMFVLAVLIGGIVLTALVGLVLIAMGIFSVRLWWIKRKLTAAAKRGDSKNRSDGGGEVVDGEYRVVDIRERDESGR